MQPIRLLLVDDHEPFLASLASFLGEEDDFCVIGSVSDGGEAVEACRGLDPDVVLMDVFMPRVDGLQATRSIVEEGLRARVVVLTGQEDPELGRRSAEAGAVGFVFKHEAALTLSDAIRAAAQGTSGASFPSPDED